MCPLSKRSNFEIQVEFVLGDMRIKSPNLENSDNPEQLVSLCKYDLNPRH